MRILTVNVNTTESMTEGIGEQARKVAAEGTEIVALTPRFGAESVEGNFESYLAAVAVMDRVLSYPEPYDAVIQAGYGEHGREGLQELLYVPVVDITEAAASTAIPLARTDAHRASSPASFSRSSISGTARSNVVTTEYLWPSRHATCAAASVMSTTGTLSSSCSPSRPCSPNPAWITASYGWS